MRIDNIIRLLKTVRDRYCSFRIMLYELLTDADIEGNPQKKQPCIFTGPGKFIFGNNVALGYFPSPHFWSTYCHFDTRMQESVIKIGSEVIINNNFSCIAYGKIFIGDYTLIGANVNIIDFDGHGLAPSCRRTGAGEQADITIGQNVWIGSNVVILKGVMIGDNSVIATGSVVVKSIPPNVVAAGNPCRVVKDLPSDP